MQCNKVGKKKTKTIKLHNLKSGKVTLSMPVKLHPALRRIWDMNNKND